MTINTKYFDVDLKNDKNRVAMIVIISTLIFAVVMYLMMKVMIDRSAFSISLIKVFGF